MRVRLIAQLSLLAVAVAPAANAQDSRLTVERIFGRGEFASAPLPTIRWMRDGRSYLDTRPNAAGGTDIVRVDVVTGAQTVLADAATLVGRDGKRIAVEDVALSDDESRALIFYNSVRVWRSNTRGEYGVVDFAAKTVTPLVTVTTPSPRPSTQRDTSANPALGKSERERQPSFLARGLASGAADPDLQMFAKFSPDGRQVAYVRANNLWVTDLTTGASRALTTDGSDDIINGTTDWVYEEELGLRDAFRWSPDSKRIAFWRFDQSAVPAFPMVDQVDGAYPSVAVLRYPKAGAPNSQVRVAVIDAAGGTPRWLDVGADTGIYVARMDWVGNDSLVVTRLTRKQDQVDLLMLSGASGKGRVMFTDRDSAYVDVEGDEVVWLPGEKQFLWTSDRSGWRQVYLVDRAGRIVRQVTRDGSDVTAIVGLDAARGQLYVQMAAPDPTQRQVYRFPLAGGGAGERVTTARGAHTLTIGPGAHYAVDFASGLGRATTVALYELPAMRERRVLADNATLTQRLGALATRAPEFFRVPLPNGVQLDAYRIVPANFDSTRKYPVLMYVYGGPASPQVVDQWGGGRYLWHQLLAQHGYVVVAVDNRGAAWRGRDFRKITQYRLGTYESQDQIDAAKWLAARPWVDGRRIGMWGWSYGGYLTSLTLTKGGSVFKTGIAVAPVTDWRLYDTIYTERFMWTPQRNPEGYRDAAPQSHVAGLTAKLLLVHGTGDDNVHVQNTLQMANELEAAGKPFFMLLYPNRTHSISGGNTQAHLFDQLTSWVLSTL